MGTPEGMPSTIVVRALPWDSPAVKKRKLNFSPPHPCFQRIPLFFPQFLTLGFETHPKAPALKPELFGLTLVLRGSYPKLITYLPFFASLRRLKKGR